MVTAFSVEAKDVSTGTYLGLPVVPFEDICDRYPPDQYRVFVALTPPQRYRSRNLLYDAVKSAGYKCASYVSSRAFYVRNVQIGENSLVQEFVALQHRARIGNNVFVGSGTCVGHSAVIEDNCWIGRHVNIAGFSRIGRDSSLGDNSCIADVIKVAYDSIISPGAVVLRDTRSGLLYSGNPAAPARPNSM